MNRDCSELRPMPNGWFPAEAKEGQAKVVLADLGRGMFFGVWLSAVAQKMVNNIRISNQPGLADEPAG